MKVELHGKDAAEALASLEGSALRRRALPLLSRRHRGLRRNARTFEAESGAGERAILCLAPEGVLCDFLASPDADSAFLAQVWRAARELADLRGVEVRSDDALLLPFALHQGCPDETSVVARWYLPRARAPLTPELRERAGALVEVPDEPPGEALLERAGEILRGGQVPVIEVPEESRPLAAALRAAGFQESVVVLRRRFAAVAC
jgi:hypothetical protein